MTFQYKFACTKFDQIGLERPGIVLWIKRPGIVLWIIIKKTRYRIADNY